MKPRGEQRGYSVRHRPCLGIKLKKTKTKQQHTKTPNKQLWCNMIENGKCGCKMKGKLIFKCDQLLWRLWQPTLQGAAQQGIQLRVDFRLLLQHVVQQLVLSRAVDLCLFQPALHNFQLGVFLRRLQTLRCRENRSSDFCPRAQMSPNSVSATGRAAPEWNPQLTSPTEPFRVLSSLI